MILPRYALCIFAVHVGAEVESKVADGANAVTHANTRRIRRKPAVTSNGVDKASKHPNTIPLSLMNSSGASMPLQPKESVVKEASSAHAHVARPDSSAPHRVNTENDAPLPDSVKEENNRSGPNEQQELNSAVLVEDSEKDQQVPAHSESLQSEEGVHATSQLGALEKKDDDGPASSASFQGAFLLQRNNADEGKQQDKDDHDGDRGAAHGQLPLMLTQGADSHTAAPTINNHDQTSHDGQTASRFFISAQHQKLGQERKWAIGIGIVVSFILVGFAASMARDRE